MLVFKWPCDHSEEVTHKNGITTKSSSATAMNLWNN